MSFFPSDSDATCTSPTHSGITSEYFLCFIVPLCYCPMTKAWWRAHAALQSWGYWTYSFIYGICSLGILCHLIPEVLITSFLKFFSPTLHISFQKCSCNWIYSKERKLISFYVLVTLYVSRLIWRWGRNSRNLWKLEIKV